MAAEALMRVQASRVELWAQPFCEEDWIPACAGMSGECDERARSLYADLRIGTGGSASAAGSRSFLACE